MLTVWSLFSADVDCLVPFWLQMTITHFDIELHHGGHILFYNDDPQRPYYNGGYCTVHPQYDKDHISYFELASLWEQFNYHKDARMFGLEPGGRPSEGFYKLEDDDDVIPWVDLHAEFGCPQLVVYVDGCAIVEEETVEEFTVVECVQYEDEDEEEAEGEEDDDEHTQYLKETLENL